MNTTIETPRKATYVRESGFTLLETLLAIGLSSILMAFLINTMQSWAEIEKASAAAAYMETMVDAVDDMTETYEYFDVLFKEAENAGGTLQIGVLDSEGFSISLESGAWNGTRQVLPGSAQITPSYVNLSPFRRGFAIVVAANRSGSGANERTLEIALVSRTPVPEKQAREAAAKIGSSGGIISVRSVLPGSECLASGCARTLRGIYNDWKVDMATFAGTEWEANASANPPSLLDGAYVVYYRYYTAGESAGDYLYRIPIAGSPEANRMNIELDMAGNSILGADNVRVRDVYLRDYAAVEGSVSVTGNFSAQDMTVRGDVQAGTIRMLKTYNADPRLLELHGGRITNTVTVDGTLIAPDISVTTLSVSDITAQDFTAANLTANQFNHVGTLNVGNFSAAALQARTFSASNLIVGNMSSPAGAPLNFTSVLANTLNLTSLTASDLTANVSSGSTSIGLLTACTGCY